MEQKIQEKKECFGADGKPYPCKKEKEVCQKDGEQKYCIGGKLANDINSKRRKNCPCKSSESYSNLIK